MRTDRATQQCLYHIKELPGPVREIRSVRRAGGKAAIPPRTPAYTH